MPSVSPTSTFQSLAFLPSQLKSTISKKPSLRPIRKKEVLPLCILSPSLQQAAEKRWYQSLHGLDHILPIGTNLWAGPFSLQPSISYSGQTQHFYTSRFFHPIPYDLCLTQIGTGTHFWDTYNPSVPDSLLSRMSSTKASPCTSNQTLNSLLAVKPFLPSQISHPGSTPLPAPPGFSHCQYLF